MTREEMDFISGMNMCDEISNEAYKKIMCHCEEQEPCEDAISRQEVLDLAEWFDLNQQHFTVANLIDEVENMPSIQQEPKTGHWIEKDGFDGDVYYDCSECGESWATIEGTPWDNGMNYCPQCGARMVEPQERSDKE